MADERYRFGDVAGPVQTGDGIQNVAGGDQYIAGRDQAVAVGAGREVLAELAHLRQALGGLRLTAEERARAERELGEVEGAMRRREPDVRAASGHLESFVSGLKEAGALASAGTSLVESIAKIARTLGPLAVGVLALL
jgi:hypothetical protein